MTLDSPTIPRRADDARRLLTVDEADGIRRRENQAAGSIFDDANLFPSTGLQFGLDGPLPRRLLWSERWLYLMAAIKGRG